MRNTAKSNLHPDQRVLVWDLPLRIFHWGLAIAFVVSWITAEAGIEWADLHLYSGYSVLGLITFRLIWGIVGTRHARFRNFIRGPRALISGLDHIVKKTAPAAPGHSAVGGWASVVLIVLMLFQAASGLFITDDILFSGPYNSIVSSAVADKLGSFHNFNFNLLIIAVSAHLCVMLWYAVHKNHNLVAPMITGHAHYTPEQGISSSDVLRAFICASVAAGLLGVLIMFAPEPEYFF
jgi:cytochrome b